MKAYLVLIAAIAFAIAPFLSPEFGGFDPDRYPIPQNDPPVQPAGWAFAIWGIIYLALLVHAVIGVFKQKADPVWENGRLSLFISLAVGAFWLPVALVSPIWATLMIWLMLISVLVSLYQTLRAEPNVIANWPVALYAGWLSAASFVSIGLMLAGYGVLDEVPAAIVSLALALAFVLINQNKLRHWTYGVASAWGFFGIATANYGSETLVAILAFAATLIVLAQIGMQLKPRSAAS